MKSRKHKNNNKIVNGKQKKLIISCASPTTQHHYVLNTAHQKKILFKIIYCIITAARPISFIGFNVKKRVHGVNIIINKLRFVKQCILKSK